MSETNCKQALHSAFTKLPPLITTSPCRKQLDLMFSLCNLLLLTLMFSIIFYLSSVNHIHGTGCRSLINQMWTTHNAYTNSDSRSRENYESRYIQCNEVLNLRKSFHLTSFCSKSKKKIISEQMQSFDSFHLSLLQLEQYAKKNLYASNNWQILVCQVNSGARVGWWL